MMRYRIRFELVEYWHAGSGAGRGPRVDAAVVRTAAGLPYLPGKTVRGLLRDAFELARNHPAVAPLAIDAMFGREDEQGLVRLSDATLGEEAERWAHSARGEPEAFFDLVRSTAVDRTTGQAAKGTLRSIEVAVPVELEATLYCLDGFDPGPESLSAALSFLRSLGANRRRGLGRVRATLAAAE